MFGDILSRWEGYPDRLKKFWFLLAAIFNWKLLRVFIVKRWSKTFQSSERVTETIFGLLYIFEFLPQEITYNYVMAHNSLANGHDHKIWFLRVLYSWNESINSCNKNNHHHSVLRSVLIPYFFWGGSRFLQVYRGDDKKKVKRKHVHLVYIIQWTIYNCVFLTLFPGSNPTLPPRGWAEEESGNELGRVITLGAWITPNASSFHLRKIKKII